MMNLSGTFHIAFTHLSATFHISKIEDKPLKEGDLHRHLS